MGTVRRRASGSASRRPSARALAADVVRRVTDEGAYSNLTLAAALERSRLSPRDRRFAAELAYGTLRRLLRLDASLAPLVHRSLEALDGPTRAAVRLGAYQILFTRVPSHAAVGETVTLAPQRARGFVNAVLRRLASAPPPEITGTDEAAISARTGMSAWAVAELARLLPPEEVEPAAAALAEPAPLSLRVNECRTTPDQLARALAAARHPAMPGRHRPDVRLVSSATPALLPGYQEGWFAVQDEASVLVAAALDVQPGERVLDACAGPGGKASHLACDAGEVGLTVGADVNEARARLVRSAAARLRVPVRTLVQDAGRPAIAPASFDAILVDAPCSGLGAARRRPELLWRPSKDRLSQLARLQVAILCGAADLLRPSGRLVYSVCTFPRAETDAVVRAFLAKRPDVTPVAVPGPDGSATSHRLWPHRHGTDAMFFAGFGRAADHGG